MDNKVEKQETKETIKKQRIKEAKFVNITEINEDIINKFYKFYKYHVKRFDFYSFLICGVILILIGIRLLINEDTYFLGVIFNIMVSIVLILIGIYFWISAFKAQKYDKKNMIRIYAEDISKITNDYFFDNDKVIIVNKFGETERVYEYLDAIYESKEFYYIFTTSKNAYIMKKDSFKKGKEEEFNIFIKEKMGKNYKKRFLINKK